MNRGFSLIELLVAMVITLGTGAIVFQLFEQNEHVFRDQYLVMEMQQSGRLVAAQIADDIRIAGQGVPIYSTTFDDTPSEATAVVMEGSDSSRVNLRSGYSNIESGIAGPNPLDLNLNATTIVNVSNASLFSNAIGNTPDGRYVYVWGPASDSTWSWVRSSVVSISAPANTIRITAEQSANAAASVQFPAPATISLEEAVALYMDPATHSIRRTTATGTTNPASPIWAAANALAENVTSLVFTYYDKSGNIVTPNSLANRTTVARIDARIELQTSGNLSNGVRPQIVLRVRCIPRNLLSR